MRRGLPCRDVGVGIGDEDEDLLGAPDEDLGMTAREALCGSRIHDEVNRSGGREIHRQKASQTPYRRYLQGDEDLQNDN